MRLQKQIAAAAVSGLLSMAASCGIQGDKNAARALLETSVEASGGMEAADAWKTMTKTGELTVHWPGWGTLHAKCSLKVKRPDKLVLDQDFTVHNHPFFFTYFYNEGEVWGVVNLGVRQDARYTEAMTRTMKDTGGMHYYLTECDTFFVVAVVPDDSLVAGSSIDRVGIVDNGDTVMVDLDRQTHLPVRLIRDAGEQQALFSDYRQVDRLAVPFKMTVYENGAVEADYVWENILFDEPIDEAVFEEYRPMEEAPSSESTG
jgi:hypothetical protein